MKLASVWRACAAGILALGATLIGACAGGDSDSQLERLKEEAQKERGPIPAYAGFFGNLDFEAGEENEGDEYEITVAWKGGGAGYEYALETQAPRSGAFAARLRRVRDDVPPPNNFGAITQCADAAPFHGAKLRFSAWVRTEGVTDGFCGLYVRVDGDALRPLSFDNMESRPIRGTTGWTRYEVVFDVPPAARGMCFGLVFTGAGTVWMDDAKFERVSAGAT